MAKKTTNYGANTALIQGAAAAYKNYDNVAGMYAGLQLATQAGANLATAVIDKQSEENKKYNESVKLYDDAADQVLLNSGTLSQKLYDSTYDELVKAKKTYLEGIDQKDDKKRIEGLKFIQNHSNWIQNHKAFNLQHAKDVKDGLMTSDYTAEENNIIAKIQTGDYTKTSRDEKTGDIIFHLELPGETTVEMPGSMSQNEFDKLLAREQDLENDSFSELAEMFNSETGANFGDSDWNDKFDEWKKKPRKTVDKKTQTTVERKVSSKEYEQLASIFKNDKVGVAHMEGKKYVLSQEIFDADGYLVKVLGSLPSNESEWRGMVGNDLPGKRGGKQNLKSLLEQDMANGTLESEIINALGIDTVKFDTNEKEEGVKTNAAGYYIDAKGNRIEGLTPGEKANFIDAVVNHTNDDFDLETSNQILKERLLKEAEEEHAEHWQKINAEKKRLEDEQSRRFNLANQQKEGGRALSYGYRYDSQMKDDYEFVKNAKEGDITNVYYEGEVRTIVKQKDGNWKYDLGDGVFFTPDRVRQLKEYTHLPVLEGAADNTDVLEQVIIQPEIPASLKELNRKKVEIANNTTLSEEQKEEKIKEIEELYKKQQ